MFTLYYIVCQDIYNIQTQQQNRCPQLPECPDLWSGSFTPFLLQLFCIIF